VNVARLLSALAGGAARRPVLVLALAATLGLGAAALALGLHTSAATDTFVGRSTAGYKATQRYYHSFGEEPVDVMVQGNLQQLLLSSDIDRLVGLEGCLSGKVPRAGLPREGGVNGPCGQLDRLGSVKVVIGPGTFIDEAVAQIDQLLTAEGNQAERQATQDQQAISRAALAQGRSSAEAHQLGEEAAKVTRERYAQEIALLGAEYGLSAPPNLNDPSFVYTLVFDNTAKLPGTPKERFAYLFPSREAALISVRMKAGVSEAQRARTIALVRRAIAMPQWRLQHGEHYLLTGEPVIVSDLTNSITHSIELLLLAVLLAMALALGLVFRGRPRLLALGIALLAAALTFGALAAVGASLTVAQVAVLPVLIGLSVDYAIQFQSRVQETLAGGVQDVRVAIERAAATGGPTIAAAAAAGAGALLVMTLSPVPTVRGFALLLIVGIAVALFCALTAGSAVLALSVPRLGGQPYAAAPQLHTAAPQPHAAPAPLRALGAMFGSSWRGAQELLRDNALTRLLSTAALVYAVRNPGRVIAVGLALAALGWGLDTQTRVETNLEKLVPQNLASLRNLDALERASGVGGEIDLMVSTTPRTTRAAQAAAGRRGGPPSSKQTVATPAQTVATPAVIEWMISYQNAVLKRFGYTSTRGCGLAQLCPAFSLPTLFQGGALAAGGPSGPGADGSGAGGGSAKGAGASGSNKQGDGTAGSKLTSADVNSLLRTIPPYFSQNVITTGRRVATLAFGIRLMGLEQQQHVIEAMRSSLHPPPGVSAQLVGLPVLAAQSGALVASPWRRVVTLLAGLAAAALVLLIAFRWDRRRALTPLLPVLLATGWSALVVFAIRVPLNPMSVTLSALVIAISTEFSVLLSERYRQERLAGRSLPEALRVTYNRTGAAVAASGVTAIAGFGVLVLSDINMLRDFGVVTLIDLSVSLVGVLVALPAALLLVEPGELAARPVAAGSRLAALRARLRMRHEPV
jgi:predicted RND superfamily exporter protein